MKKLDLLLLLGILGFALWFAISLSTFQSIVGKNEIGTGVILEQSKESQLSTEELQQVPNLWFSEEGEVYYRVQMLSGNFQKDTINVAVYDAQIGDTISVKNDHGFIYR